MSAGAGLLSRCRHPAAGLLAALVALSLPVASEAQQREQPRASEQVMDAYLSEDALQVLYGRTLPIGQIEDARVRVGFFINEDRDLIGIGDASVDVIDPTRRRRWGLEVGPRAYGALLSNEDEDIFAIGLGGRASYYFDAERQTSVSLTMYYAPDIITFGTADNVKDFSISIETPLTERMRIYVGYRTFELDLPTDREVDDGLHLGLRGNF